MAAAAAAARRRACARSPDCAPEERRVAVDDDVWLDAAAVADCRRRRDASGRIFQDYALFPHMLPRQNVEYARRQAADEYLERFRISHLANAHPTELSGGERQRVALARALAGPRRCCCSTNRSRRSTRTRRRRCARSSTTSSRRSTSRAPRHARLRGRGGPRGPRQCDRRGATATDRRSGRARRRARRRVRRVVHGSEPAARRRVRTRRSTRVRLDDGTVVATAEPAHGRVALAVYPWDITLATTPRTTRR